MTGRAHSRSLHRTSGFITAVQHRLESWCAPLISLKFSKSIRLSQDQVHHRGTEGTEREIYFFVHREIPMDEKDVPNEIPGTALFMVLVSKTLDQQEVCSRRFECGGPWPAFFCLSVSPDKQKRYLCVLCASVVRFFFGQA